MNDAGLSLLVKTATRDLNPKGQTKSEALNSLCSFPSRSSYFGSSVSLELISLEERFDNAQYIPIPRLSLKYHV